MHRRPGQQGPDPASPSPPAGCNSIDEDNARSDCASSLSSVVSLISGDDDSYRPRLRLLWIWLPQLLRYCLPRHRQRDAQDLIVVLVIDSTMTGQVDLRILSLGRRWHDSQQPFVFPVWCLFFISFARSASKLGTSPAPPADGEGPCRCRSCHVVLTHPLFSSLPPTSVVHVVIANSWRCTSPSTVDIRHRQSCIASSPATGALYILTSNLSCYIVLYMYSKMYNVLYRTFG